MKKRDHEVLAFIPARGNSKGLPRKNSRLLAGKPLLAWTIEVALKARLITRVIVSTEDEVLADIAKANGAEVPFMRPKSLARDDSLIGQALKYSLERLIKEEGYRPECLVELYPTHPFRTPALLDHLTGKLLEGYDEVFTVRPVDFDPERFAVQKAEGGLTGLVGLDPSIGGTYRRYGQFSGRRLLRTECYRGYAHVIENPVELVDIDYLEDFLLAEQIILRNMYDFGAS